MSAAASPATRAQTVIQRAYVYIVALVAVHMIVLGVANILRVIAEMLLGAPSGGFTGLPFEYADYTRTRDLYREQASLAIAQHAGLSHVQCVPSLAVIEVHAGLLRQTGDLGLEFADRHGLHCGVSVAD